jgi:hypothetical protein
MIDDMAKSIPQLAIDQKPSRLVIVPDYLSATYLKEYLTRIGKASVLFDLEITTFEDLAVKIVSSNASILDPELLKLILTKCVLSMKDPITEKIAQSLTNTEPPEDSPFVEPLRNEFSEYASLISPNYRDADVTRQKMQGVLQNLSTLVRTRARIVLDFYSSLEREAVKTLSELNMGSDVYLSRAHLVSEACLKLERNQLEVLIDSDKITSIYIVGVPIFDDTVTDLLSILCLKTDKVIINATPEIQARLEKRLRARVGNSVAFAASIQPTSNVFVKITEYSVPDRRREVELATLKIIELLENGIPADEIVIASRLVSDYAPYVESVFRDYGISSFIQTRIGIVYSPAYKLIQSLLDLLVSWTRASMVSAIQISTPLRVGFPINATWKGERRRSKWPINDKQFLGIETTLESIQAYSKDDTLNAWLKKIRDRHAKASQEMGDYIYDPIIQLLEWLEKTANEPVGIKPLVKVLRRFIEAYGVEREFPVLSLVPNGRFSLSKEHLSSQAERILRGLYELVEHQKYVAQARNMILGNTRSLTQKTTWADLRKSFLGNVGQMTYGLTFRDNDAIRIVDAGISHFVNTTNRIILGMTTDQFPRGVPEPFLISSELRAELNLCSYGYFMTDRQTHYEIEKYYFVTAKGRNNDLIISMNYLDERGHSQHWSVLHYPNNTIRIAPQELRVELSQDFLKRANNESHNLNNILFQRISSVQSKTVTELTAEIDDAFSSLIASDHLTKEKVSIKGSVSALLDRVINGVFDPAITRGPTDISDVVFKKTREPSIWELDMVTYCPAMYYFYVFLYLMPNREWIKEKHDVDALLFSPAYKDDFRLGRIPLPIWRTQFSTEASCWIEKHLKNTRKISRSKIAQIENEVDKLDVHIAEKAAIKALLAHAGSLNSYKFHPREKSSKADVYRPISLWYQLDEERTGKLRVFYRFTPKQPHKYTHLSNAYSYATSPLVPDYKYTGFEGTYTQDEALEGVRNLSKFMKLISLRSNGEMSLESQVCDDCVYMTLCGRWGF